MNQILREIDDFEIIFPDVTGAGVNEDIVFTKKAFNKIVNEIEENYVFYDDVNEKTEYFVRLSVTTSANFAKKYSISVENQINDFDRIYELRKVKIVIDRKSLFYFMGVVIDYVDSEDDLDENSDLEMKNLYADLENPEEKVAGFIFKDFSEYED
jgi:Fe-S cluster assembly iron-binding protein IscA